MKLHLGCGEYYLKGYINIDLPLPKRPLKKLSKADLHVDILKLKYPSNTSEEIRLHHVFEHFPRPIACALISTWYVWLKPDGILRIEVPDFYRTALIVLLPFVGQKYKARALRHLYGSHEAQWAHHYEGYTSESLSFFLKQYGFKIIEVRRNSWKGTHNFEIIAQKKISGLDKNSLERITKDYLKLFLVSQSEQKLLQVWIDVYKKQMNKSSVVLQ